MQEVIDFLKAKNVEKTKFFNQLKCSLEEAKILQYLSKEYINGRDVLSTIDILGQFYSIEKYEHLEKLSLIKSLLEYGWLIQVAFDQVKLNEASKVYDEKIWRMPILDEYKEMIKHNEADLTNSAASEPSNSGSSMARSSSK